MKRCGNVLGQEMEGNYRKVFPILDEQMTTTHGGNKVSYRLLPKKESSVNPIAYYRAALKATLFLPAVVG